MCVCVCVCVCVVYARIIGPRENNLRFINTVIVLIVYYNSKVIILYLLCSHLSADTVVIFKRSDSETAYVLILCALRSVYLLSAVGS